jgi:hypothetical protein
VSKFTNYGNFNKDVINDVVKLAEQIENEKKNIEPDQEMITRLMYQQLLRGMELNSGYNRQFYNPY